MTFAAPVTFSGVSVVAEKRGGAINNNGYLVFEHSANFSSCSVQNPPQNPPEAAAATAAAEAAEAAAAAAAATRLPGPDGLNNTAAAATAAATADVAAAAASGQNGTATGGAVVQWGCGGAIFNGPSGRAWFRGVAWFEDNRAGDGSAGGGLCNEGTAQFLGRAYFTGNGAAGELRACPHRKTRR